MDKKKSKNKINEKDLYLLIHDLYKNFDLDEDDLEYNMQYLVEHVIDLYYCVNSLKDYDELYSLTYKLIKNRFPLKDPKSSEEEIIRNIKQVNYLKTIPQPEQRTPEWYIFRNNRLTASDLACAVNKNPYSNRDKLVLKKCGHEEPWNPGPAIEHGVKYEDEAIRVYSGRNNVTVKEYGCIPHPNISFFGASPDGICDPESENKNLIGYMLEIKCPKSRPITGFPPEYYFYQVQGQLEVCDLEYCHFLECDIREYKNKVEFFQDCYTDENNNKNINLQKNGMEKGVVIELYDHKLKKMVYRYSKPNITEFELTSWEEQIIDISLEDDTLDYIKTSYWKLVEYCCTLIKRDREWFKNVYPEIERFWNDVLKYRTIGIDTLKKEKKIYKKQNNHLEIKFLD